METQATKTTKSPWVWHPELPINADPVLVWPPQPFSILKFYFGKGFLFSQNLAYILLAILSWFYLAPSMDRWSTFALDWILELYLLNMTCTVLLAGSLHLYFHTFRRQSEHKYDPHELDRNNPKFLFNNQVWDNIFWTCASGVTVWTAYQVIVMWAYANGIAPWLGWEDNPIFFVLLFPLLMAWESLHFYLNHRLLHWRPLYRVAHALHHRNIVVGPWSGFSMHPIEHLLYFSCIFIFFIVASHPIHMFFLMYHTALAAITSHTGYDDLTVNGKSALKLGFFFHQLHHRYFDCNFGTVNVPCDRWAGSMHDGSPEATEALRAEQKRRRQACRDSD